jgi:ABC-type uncharacterized transport system permease subunit
MNDAALVLESAARLSALLLFVGLGELLAERAGTLNISVEGMMLGAAYGAAFVASGVGSAFVGLIAGVAVGALVALIQAELSHRLPLNQFIVGLAINLLVLGITGFLYASVDLHHHQLEVLKIPLLTHIPLVGKALFEQRWPFFLIYAAIPLTWWLLMRTRWGLELRACGENPVSARASGIQVRQRRRQAILVCGVYAGLGGSFLSVGLIGSFSPNMTAGRGFVAIAAVIIGSWSVRGAVLGALIFGGTDALRLALPAIGVDLIPQVLIAAPYLIAMTTMLVFAQGQRQPLALGQGYEGLAA